MAAARGLDGATAEALLASERRAKKRKKNLADGGRSGGAF